VHSFIAKKPITSKKFVGEKEERLFGVFCANLFCFVLNEFVLNLRFVPPCVRKKCKYFVDLNRIFVLKTVMNGFWERENFVA
jgi:hypothetical protein